MKAKITLFLTVLLIFICCIGAASAADDINGNTLTTDNDVVNVEQATDDVDLEADSSEDTILEVNNDEEVLEATTPTVSTWADLASNASASGSAKTIYLASGKTFTPTSQIVFGNSATIIGTPTSYISGTYSGIPFVNNNRANSITFQNVIFKDMTCQMIMQMQTNGITILDGCTFTNIKTGENHDSVIYNNWGTMNVTDCTFTNCKTGFGVITNYNWMSQTSIILNVKNSKFENNIALSEPGAINNCAVLTVYNSTFLKNNSTMWAGAIHTHYRASSVIEKSTFKGNYAKENGGALFTYSVLKIYDSIFEDNECGTTTGGGAIGSYNYVSTYNIWIENSTFKGNKNNAAGGHGGAITALNGGYLNVYDSTFENNYADIGQAICAYNQINDENETGGTPRLAIEGCTFENHAGTSDTVYATGYISSFEDNTFIDSTQSTHFSGSGNSYNSVNLPVLLISKHDELLSSSFNQDVLETGPSSEIYVNASSTNPVTGRKSSSTTGIDWNTAYGTEKCLNIAVDNIENGGKIIVANGEYTVKPDYDMSILEQYAKGWTIEGFGDNVIFSFEGTYNLDSGSNARYGQKTNDKYAVNNNITHKNIIFDCDVKVGSKNFKFVDCTFNKGVEISRDYVSDDICNIAFENCIFANPKSDIVVADKNDVIYNDCTFPVTAIGTNITISSSERSIVNIIVKDAEGNPVANANVKYSINGENKTDITDANGTITINDLTGEITIAADFEGNESYFSSNSTEKFNFTIPKVATSLSATKVSATYNVAKNLVITLKDSDNNVLANKNVTVKVGTISKTLTTNAKGQVSVNVATLVPKTYTATFTFAGDNTTLASNGKVNVVVAKATPKITTKKLTTKVKVKTKKVTATLKDNKGKVLKNTKVTLKIKGKTYKATTNKKGVATFKVTKLNKKGTFKGTVKFVGNKYFKAISKKVTVVVKK